MTTAQGVLTTSNTGGGGSTFLPTDLSSLEYWFDPNDTSTLWQNTQGTTPAGIWDSVARIDDKSSNGYFLSQSVSASRPTFTASGLSFDGSDFLFANTTTEGTGVGTNSAFFAVGYLTNNTNAYRAMLSHAYAAFGYKLGLNNSVTAARIAVGSGAGASTQVTNSMATMYNTMAMLSGVFDNTNNLLYGYRDGILLNAGGSSAAFDLAYNGSDRLAIGAMVGSGSANRWVGYIHDCIMLVNPAAGDVDSIHAYLKDKHGIT